jgi:hypothetical protein
MPPRHTHLPGYEVSEEIPHFALIPDSIRHNIPTPPLPELKRALDTNKHTHSSEKINLTDSSQCALPALLPLPAPKANQENGEEE